MRAKHFISILLVVLLFNSCKKIREKLLSTRMEGKVVDIQTGKGIPYAKLVVYEAKGDQGYVGRIFRPLKTFYADDEGNFCDKIKILFPDEATEPYITYILKAEPDGYEKTEGTDYPISGTGILPWGYLRLTRVNKNMVLQCNPEFELEIKLIDDAPIFNGTLKNLLSFKTNTLNRFYNIVYPPLSGSDNKAATIFYRNDTLVSFLLPAMDFDLLLYGNNNSVNPPTRMRLDSMRISHFAKKQITIKY